MFSVRLVVVLALHAVLVAGGLVTVVVVYEKLNSAFAEWQVIAVATATVQGVQQMVQERLMQAEITIFYISIMLSRLSNGAPLASTSRDVRSYTKALEVLTVPGTIDNTDFISAFAMWFNATLDDWVETGCDRETGLCCVYDPATNTTQCTAFDAANAVTPINASAPVTTSAGPPKRHDRHLLGIAVEQVTSGGWWGPLYIEPAQNISTMMCGDVQALYSIDYMYCTQWVPSASESSGSAQPKCVEVVGATVNARPSSSGSAPTVISISTSSVYLVARDYVDLIDYRCKPPPDVIAAVDNFFQRCTISNLGNCDTTVTNAGANVISVVGSSSTAGLDGVLVDVVPRASFYNALDRSRSVAIAVSVSVIVLVVVVSVALCACLVIPLSFICTGMRTASTLSHERRVLPLRHYTFVTEMKELVAAYLELRQALTDLKAFVPQGLLVASNSTTLQNSVLSALAGAMTDDSDVSVVCSASGSAAMSIGAEAVQRDAATAADDEDSGRSFSVPVSLSNVYVGATAAATPARCRSDATAPPEGTRGESRWRRWPRAKAVGIVSVVPIGAVDDGGADDDVDMAEDGATTTAGGGRNRGGVFASAAGLTDTAPRRRRTSFAPAAAASASATVASARARLREKDGGGGGGGGGGRSVRHQQSTLNLNAALCQSDLNRFRVVACSVLCVGFSFKYIDPESIEAEARAVSDVVVRCVLRYGGVVEMFRPDLAIVSYGAHATQLQHAQSATATAIAIARLLTPPQQSRTRLVVDTGSLHCGISGAHGRTFPVVFGDRLDAAVDLLRYDRGLGRLIVTDRVAVCLPGDYVVPIDYVVTHRARAHGTQLFQILNTRLRGSPDFKEAVSRFRSVYALAVDGQYEEALRMTEGLRAFDAGLADSYASSFAYLLSTHPRRPRYCRFQLPGFEPLGVVSREAHPRYHHAPLHLTDLQNGSSGTVSIHFGFDNSASASAATAAVASSGAAPQDSTSRTDAVVSLAAVEETRFAAAVPAAASARALMTSAPCNAMCGAASTSRSHRSPSRSKPGTDVVDGVLPTTFTDRRGERWHRFPTMLGRGAFAEVYQAISSNGAVVALKCIRLSDAKVQLADVVGEVNTACKLVSDFTVTHTGWAHVGSYMIIIMDYMPGGSLRAVLSAFPGGLTLPIAKRYASDALRGLAYLHRSGIVHADLKPQNMLLSADGGCRLSDFGSSVTKANARLCSHDVFQLRGTPLYMSPEVARGDAPSMMSDMWSFGVSLYEMLTGRLPWQMKRAAPFDATATAAAAAAAVSQPCAVVRATDEVFGDVSPSASVRGAAVASDAAAAAANPLFLPAPIVRARLSESRTTPRAAWGPLEGLSDARIVQGIANGSVRAHVEAAELPNAEAYQLITACLRDSPAARPHSWETVNHSFFLVD